MQTTSGSMWTRSSTSSSTLCAVFASSITAPNLYTSRPQDSLPPDLPVVVGTLLDYPRRRHAAIVQVFHGYQAVHHFFVCWHVIGAAQGESTDTHDFIRGLFPTGFDGLVGDGDL